MNVTINNDNNVIEDINQKNEIFIRELMSKDSFMLDWYAGAVLPKHHPRYYDGRIEVVIRNAFNSSYGTINFGKDEYQITDDLVNNLFNYIETNIDKLIKIALNQSTEMYEYGTRDVLRIKFKSLYISISERNGSSEEEKNEIYKIKEEIKNLICVNKKTTDNIEVNDANTITFEKAKEIAKEEAGKHGKIIETIEENDDYWLFKAGFEDGHVDFDDGVGSIYISKADGSTRGLNLWDMDFTRKFKESAKVIYNYSDNK